MRRSAIAVVWIAGTTLPLFAAAVFIFGCCVLPFHRTIHSLMPLCLSVSSVIHHAQDDDHPASPPGQKDERTSRSCASVIMGRHSIDRAQETRIIRIDRSRAAYRSFISLGAIRCDQDVGLRLLLLDTFLI